mgnify:CR=1 FL=1
MFSHLIDTDWKREGKGSSIVFQELEKRLTNGFSEEEQKMLYSYLERMLCNLRNEEVSL